MWETNKFNITVGAFSEFLPHCEIAHAVVSTIHCPVPSAAPLYFQFLVTNPPAVGTCTRNRGTVMIPKDKSKVWVKGHWKPRNLGEDHTRPALTTSLSTSCYPDGESRSGVSFPLPKETSAPHIRCWCQEHSVSYQFLHCMCTGRRVSLFFTYRRRSTHAFQQDLIGASQPHDADVGKAGGLYVDLFRSGSMSELHQQVVVCICVAKQYWDIP